MLPRGSRLPSRQPERRRDASKSSASIENAAAVARPRPNNLGLVFLSRRVIADGSLCKHIEQDGLTGVSTAKLQLGGSPLGRKGAYGECRLPRCDRGCRSKAAARCNGREPSVLPAGEITEMAVADWVVLPDARRRQCRRRQCLLQR